MPTRKQLAPQTFTLAYPPSANHYWRMARGHIHKSNEARAYQNMAALTARIAGVKPLQGSVGVTIQVYRPAKRGDLDNCLKVCLDALKGIAYADDKQIIEINALRHEDAKNPRIVVTIVELEEQK